MHKVLAVVTAVLLVVAVAAAGLETSERPSAPAATPASPSPIRSTGLPQGQVATAAEPAAVAPPETTGSPAATAAGAPRRRPFPVATPAQFNVPRPQPKVDGRLVEQLDAAAPGDRLVVFVHAADADFARRAAEAGGLTVLTSFDKVGVVAAAGAPDSVRQLADARGISYLEADRPLEYFQNTSHDATRGAEARRGFSVTYSEAQPDKPGTSKRVCTTKRNRRGRIVRDRRGRPVRTCRRVTTAPQPQPPIPRTLTSTGVDGSGVTIAIIDSGIDATHPMFQQDGKSKVVRNFKYVAGRGFVPVSDADSLSLGGHGTHVAGIAAGVDVTTSDGRRLHGAAPGAKLVGLGMGSTPLTLANTTEALNWVLRNHLDPCGDKSCPPIKVSNNSYGPIAGEEFNPEATASKLQRALASEGVLTVWANGNGDTTNNGGNGSDNRSNPSGSDPTPGIISVANYNDGDTGNRDNLLAGSSSRGEKGRVLTYPDVSAPGTAILSACRPQLPVCRDTGGRDPNYGVIGGTSMAAPHVAGIIAQMFEANPGLTPAEVEDGLEDTARPFAFGGSYEPDVTNDGITSFDKGHGLVDVVGAVARARLFHVFPVGDTPCRAEGPVTVDGTGDARDAASAEGTPAPNEPALDVVAGSVGWTGDALQFRIDVAELGERPLAAGSDGELFNFWFTHRAVEYRVNASRSATGAESYALEGAAATAPKVTGSFDHRANRVTINLPAAALSSATVPAPREGTTLLNLFVWSRRSAGRLAPVADRTGGLCPYTVGLGAVPPPRGRTTGPDPAPKPVYAPPAAQGTLTRGGPAYTWTAGPFVAVQDPIVTGNECKGARVGSACDVRALMVEVPAGGATIEVTVTPSNPAADFDVHLYGPDGKRVGTAGGAPVLDSPTSTEKISVAVTVSGVYRIDVVPFTTAGHTFKGEAKLL